MRFCSLGSGSEGNALIVESGGCVAMLDCGFGIAETERRLARAGLQPGHLTALVVTHEHSDHLGGVARFARKHRLPVWLTQGTARFVDPQSIPAESLRIIDPAVPFAIGGIEVRPFKVPHDAAEPVQFVFSDGDARLGVMTDTGTLTAQIEEALTGCEALVLECNHDLDMLMAGPYPDRLKKRVAGKFGHLDNLTSASLLRNIDCTRLEHIVAAHLSKTNNRPMLAREALAGALRCAPDWIGVAGQEAGFAWRSI
ncbi:MAG: MBL fold metallo-hydrolase [Betaproteobacteria bacterium]|nr:MBL fold metallo-hydrolase [Betaproteobacteria bacterium]